MTAALEAEAEDQAGAGQVARAQLACGWGGHHQGRQLLVGLVQAAQQAGLSRRSPTAQVGPDLAALLQRCSAFADRQATTLAGMSR